MDVIKSDVSNLSRGRENSLIRQFDENEIADIVYRYNEEEKVLNLLIIKKFFNYIQNCDPSLLQLAGNYYQEGITNPKEIAEIENISEQEAKKKLKKLKYRAKQFGDLIKGNIGNENRSNRTDNN